MDAISGSQSPGNGPGSSEVLGIGDKADRSVAGTGTPVEEGLASGVEVHGGLEACPSGLRVPDVQAGPLGQLREVGALGLERADDFVEAEAFEERLGPDEVADGNR